MFHGFGNVGFAYGRGEMLAVDTGGIEWGARAIKAIRKVTQEPIALIIFTHGHHDHSSGTPDFLADAASRGHPKPKLWSHEGVPRYFRRHMAMAGWETHINSLQFDTDIPLERVQSSKNYKFPDCTYRDYQRLELAGEPVELHHARGETEDATWVWLPNRETALVGDLIVSSMPNAGNPTKPQRFTLEWAEALDKIAAKKPRFLVPGHGPVYRGADCREVLQDTACALRLIHDEVVRRLNRGDWPVDILEADIKLPPGLASKPHLREIYGCLPFLVRDALGTCCGWWSGQPSQLFPPVRRQHAADVLWLCGRDAMLSRALTLLRQGQNERAVALAEMVANCCPGDREARRIYARSLERLAKTKSSSIARNLLQGAASQMLRRG
jgi:alkyl sulfatase BDS1-like metallo-beta-lactamase superfamily hydrolase